MMHHLLMIVFQLLGLVGGELLLMLQILQPLGLLLLPRLLPLPEPLLPQPAGTLWNEAVSNGSISQ